jgi:Bacterial transcriptional activator domain
MGNRAEALRVFARCRNRLRSELGTTPSPEREGVWRVIDTKTGGQ